MSCWVVSKPHLDVIVQSLIVEGIIDPRDATSIGRQLWRTNVEAFNWNYDNRYADECPNPNRYRFHGVEAKYDDAAVWTLNGCYAYQASDHPDWDGTAAKALYEALEAVYSARYPIEFDERNESQRGAYLKSIGKSAQRWWGISRREQAFEGARVPRRLRAVGIAA